MRTHYVDPDFETLDEFCQWIVGGRICHVFEYHSGLIEPGPGICEVEGPRSPGIPVWLACVEYDENNVIKRILHYHGE